MSALGCVIAALVEHSHAFRLCFYMQIICVIISRRPGLFTQSVVHAASATTSPSTGTKAGADGKKAEKFFDRFGNSTISNDSDCKAQYFSILSCSVLLCS